MYLRFKLLFVLVTLFSFTALQGQAVLFTEGANQNAKSGEVQKENYPIHISDKLNSEEYLQRFQPFSFDVNQKTKSVLDTLNTEKTFWVWASDLSNFEEVDLRLVRIGTVSQLWFEVDEISNGHLNDAVADSMMLYLEQKTFPGSINPNLGVVALGNQIYGTPPNYDGDGLSDVFVVDINDGWDPEVGGGYIAGFFHPIDQTSHTNSNKRDIIYIDSYPGVYNGSTTNPLRPMGTLAHEYQHLIHHFYYGRVGKSDITFINEAQSQSAEIMIGETVSTWRYMTNTNVALLKWGGLLDDYSRAMVFTGYMWDLLGWENTKYLTQSGLNGVANIENALTQSGSPWDYGELLVNWGIANYLNDTTATGNRDYGYANPMLSGWKASATDLLLDPNVTGKTLNVIRSAVTYVVYKGVSNLTATVSNSYQYARAKIMTIEGDNITVADYVLGSEYSSPTDVIYDEIVFMLVNIEPSSTGADDFTETEFTYTSTGTTAKTTAKTYSDTPKFYWPIPYNNASEVGRFGFSNKYSVNPGGYLTTLRLYLVTGKNTDGGDIEVLGEGQLRYAIYDDDNGNPGTVIAADTIDFSLLQPEWNSFDVSDWEYAIWKNVPFHVVYEVMVPISPPDRDTHSIPLRLDDGLGQQGVSQIVTSPTTFGPMFADDISGGEHGVWNEIEFLVDATVSVEDPEVMPTSYTLEQNYPNPFNPTTVIRYQLPKAGRVDLIIYNSIGQRVRTLISKDIAAGQQSAEWDGKNDLGNQVSSGIYFYRLKAGEFNRSMKMILLR